MPRLLLLLAVAAVAYILVSKARALPAAQKRKEYFKLALLGIIAVVIYLTLTGRMHWLGAALTGLLVVLRQALPALLRYFPMLMSWYSRAGSRGGGQASTVETTYLRMHLDHGSGRLSGEILRGDLAGRQLDELDQSQLQSLYGSFRQQDAESARLLESYLQQRFGDAFTFGRDSAQSSTTSGDMSEQEALDILGLDRGAGRQQIIAAHRRLMQKLHPDRGGNDYLAAKINQAKEVLLAALQNE